MPAHIPNDYTDLREKCYLIIPVYILISLKVINSFCCPSLFCMDHVTFIVSLNYEKY